MFLLDSSLDIIMIVVAILLVMVIALLIVLLLRDKNKKEDAASLEVNNKLNELKDDLARQSKERTESLFNLEKAINQTLGQNNEKVGEKLNEINTQFLNNMLQNNKEVGKQMESLSQELGKMSQAQNQLESLQKDISGLQKVLSGNQTRGKFGERTLHLILTNVFGETSLYSEQYTLASGERPDAVVFCPEPYNLICIDSKFPFSSYEKLIDNTQEDLSHLQTEFSRDVKKHIDEIAGKYIGKSDVASFAFMFIPNDAIYIYLNNKMENVIEYAEKKKVILTSPSTLYPFLSTIYSLNIDYKRNRDLQNVLDAIKKAMSEINNLDEAWSDYLKTRKTLDNKAEEMSRRFKITKRALDKVDNINVEEE